MPPCGTRRPLFPRHKKTRPLVAQDDLSSCGAICLCRKKRHVLVAQVDVSSCGKRRHTSRCVFLLRKKRGLLLCEKARLLGGQEDMSSCSTGRHVFFNKQTRLLVTNLQIPHIATNSPPVRRQSPLMAATVVLCAAIRRCIHKKIRHYSQLFATHRH